MVSFVWFFWTQKLATFVSLVLLTQYLPRIINIFFALPVDFIQNIMHLLLKWCKVHVLMMIPNFHDLMVATNKVLIHVKTHSFLL
jgi:hypothetical protein